MNQVQISEKTRKSALKALDGMAEVINNEMLLHGEYISAHVQRPDLATAGAICGGHRACAVGALFLGGGAKIIGGTLHGAFPSERSEFLVRRPGLRLAYDTLNEVAARKHPRLLKRILEDKDRDGDYIDEAGAMEALFESGYLGSDGSCGIATKAEQRKLLAIIAAAREQITAA